MPHKRAYRRALKRVWKATGREAAQRGLPPPKVDNPQCQGEIKEGWKAQIRRRIKP